MSCGSDIVDGGVAQAARRGGFGERYRFFRGLSGRRHLFTEIDAGSLHVYRDAVLLLAETAPEGRLVGRSAFLIGRAGLSPRDRARLPAGRLFIHLLAEDEAARRRVLDDLSAPARRLAA